MLRDTSAASTSSKSTVSARAALPIPAIAAMQTSAAAMILRFMRPPPGSPSLSRGARARKRNAGALGRYNPMRAGDTGERAMRIAQDRLTFDTAPREIREITRELAGWSARQGIRNGVLTVFIRHSSASLLIQENYSPDVRRDLDEFLDRLAPQDPSRYRHNDEGPDDMPAHLKAALTQVTLTIPVIDAKLQLGTWQGVFLLEHRARPHRRELILTLIGE